MGTGIGAGFLIGPLYAAELSPAEFRGRLASLFEVAIGVGILLGYLGAWLCHGLGWRAMVGLGAVPPFVILVCLLCLPESPRYLLAAGQEEKARAVLMRVMDAEAVPQCMQEMQTALQRLQEQEGEEALRLLCCPTRAVAMMMLVGFGVCLAQQANGSEAVVYYIPHILKHAGVEGREQQLRLTMLIGACRTVFIAVGTLLVDHWGRRPLLLTSTGGATVALLWLAVSLGTGWPLWCVMGALCLFMISYAVGLGPVNMVILSEIFPYKLRATAMSMAVFMNRIVSGTVASTFLSLTQWLGASGAFLMFAFISLASTIFVFTTVPETRGRSLEQMEAFFEDMVQHGATEHRRLEEPLQQ
jgi:sugar porter (SP) family MFS transporter